MQKVILKQPKLAKVKILGIIISLFSCYMLIFENITIFQFSMLLLAGIILLGYSISYEINQDFNNNKYLHLFGFSVFKQEIALPFPDYISVFPAVLKQENEWNMIAALGTTDKSETILIKFFHKNRNLTVFRSNNKKMALEKAKNIGKMLNVRVLDKTLK